MSTGAAAFLQKGTKLKKLSLFANQLGDEGATEIADALSAGSFVHLQELDVSANSIGSQGVQRLLDVLETQAAPALEVGSFSPLCLALWEEWGNRLTAVEASLHGTNVVA